MIEPIIHPRAYIIFDTEEEALARASEEYIDERNTHGGAIYPTADGKFAWEVCGQLDEDEEAIAVDSYEPIPFTEPEE